MKTLGINRKIIVSIFTIMTLIYGIQGISYGQENLPIYVSPEEIQDKGYKIDVPIITPGETNTLKWTHCRGQNIGKISKIIESRCVLL